MRAAASSVPGLVLLSALAACAAPPPPGRPVAAAVDPGAAGAAALVAEPPGAAYAREREEQRWGIGVPPALPEQGAVDRLSGTLRATRPAPAVGPSPAGPPPSLPVPSRSLSRLSAVPASPLANPPGGGSASGFGSGRPW